MTYVFIWYVIFQFLKSPQNKNRCIWLQWYIPPSPSQWCGPSIHWHAFSGLKKPIDQRLKTCRDPSTHCGLWLIAPNLLLPGRPQCPACKGRWEAWYLRPATTLLSWAPKHSERRASCLSKPPSSNPKITQDFPQNIWTFWPTCHLPTSLIRRDYHRTHTPYPK